MLLNMHWKSIYKNTMLIMVVLSSWKLQQVKLQIAGEGEPRIKGVEDKDWSVYSLPWISIGYELKLTPLQILAFYNGIANNGRIVKPKFVREERYHGSLIRSFPTEIIKDS